MNKITTLLTISALTFIGCGGGSGGISSSGYEPPDSSGLYHTVDVKYTLNGAERPTCHNANDIGKLNPDNDDFILCTWPCGRYNGIQGRNGDTVYVWLWFRKSERTDEGVWELSDEDISEADSRVCKDI